MPDAMPVGLHNTPVLDVRAVDVRTVRFIADVLEHAATDELDPLHRAARALRDALRGGGDVTQGWGWGG